MKILFCLNHFLPAAVAGIEVYTFSLAFHLQLAGQDVAVIIPGFDSKENASYTYRGIRVIQYAEDSFEDRKMILGKTRPGGLDAFTDILRSEKPDILHFQELAPGRGVSIFHAEAAAALDIKVILTCHLSTYSCQTGNLFYKDKTPCDGVIRSIQCTACTYHVKGIRGFKSLALQAAGRLLYSSGVNAGSMDSTLGTALGFPFLIQKKKEELLQLSRICEKIIVLSHWYKKVLEANDVPPEKLHYCAQGLTGKRGYENKSDHSTSLRIAFVGRISKYKGIHLLLKALRELSVEKITVDIYGPVTEDLYAQDCFKLSAGMANVHWKGPIASEAVIPMLMGYDLLCLPSTFSEMSPLVIQEAYAAGLPVLASNVYGNAEQVTDGLTGWLFDFNDVSSLAEKLQMLADNPSLVAEAKKRIPLSRGFEVVAEEHLTLYEACGVVLLKS